MKVLLLDGYNLLFRARSGWKQGDNPIVFNFLRSFRMLVGKFNPDRVYFVLEGRPVQRLQVMSEYKAQRKYHDRDDFKRQRKLIIRMLQESFPIQVVRHPNYECDDVLAALATQRHRGDEVVVVSSDTDFYQLLQQHDNLKLYNPVKKQFIDPPEYDYVTWKALRGDSSDNIEGFRGVGDKRAKKLVENPQLLEGFLASPGHQEKFDRNIHMIQFHDLGADLDDLETNDPTIDWAGLRKRLSEMQFYSITNDKPWKKFVDTFTNLD